VIHGHITTILEDFIVPPQLAHNLPLGVGELSPQLHSYLFIILFI